MPVHNDMQEMANGITYVRDFIPVTVGGMESGFLWIYNDITETLNVENKLTEQREYYHRILNELPADIMIMSLDQKFLFINKSAVANDEMREWLIGKDMFDYARRKKIGFKRAEDRFKSFNDTLATKMPVKMIDEHDMPDGSIKYMLRFLYPFPDSSGNPEFVVGFGMDITEQIINEQLLLKQKEYYHQILNEIPADIVIFSPDHKYQFLNRNAIRNDEFREWMIGKDDFDFCAWKKIPDTTAITRRQLFNEAITSKAAVSYVDEIVKKDSTTVYILRVMYPSVDANGNVLFVIGYGIDITEQIKHKKDAELQEKRIRQLFDIIRDGVFTFDETGMVTVYNNSFLKILGIHDTYDSSLNGPLNFFNFFKNDELAQIKGHIHSLESAEKTGSSVIRLVSEKEGERYLEYTFTKRLNEADAPFIGRISDITDIVNKEEGLKEIIEKEKELNNSKTQFIRITSHELRTPLAIILSNTEILELYHTLSLPAISKIKPEVIIHRIISETKHMTQLLNDLMLVSRIESGNIEIHPEKSNITEFITGIQSELYNPYTDGRMLMVHIDNNVIVDNIDKKLLRHAILNLVNNAFKYSAGKRAPELRVINNEHYIRFEVEDFGIGIPKHEQLKLFTSFFRASNITGIPGTGVGLTVLDYVVKLHKGQITFVSELDKGSTFTITIPKI
jgi:PAS domain S-box-containing protein